MYFSSEPAAWDAEAEATSSSIIKVAAHHQSPIYPLSGPVHNRESHVALISERRSMPCLRQLSSKSSKKYLSRSNASNLNGPISLASAASSRRCVSSMKHLLPLTLLPTPPQPKVDLASWLESNLSSLQIPVASRYESKSMGELSPYGHIPWIPCPQDVPLPSNPPPDPYMETSRNFEPEPPILSRAYLVDEEPCNQCSLEGSVCDELCIVSDYEEVKAPSSHNQDSIIDTDRVGSSESANSFVSHQQSKLSSGNHRLYSSPDEATWMGSGSRFWIDSFAGEAISSSNTIEVNKKQIAFDGWLDSESSRSSSSFGSDEVHDALITKLAPAKAHVVDLGRVPQKLPRLTGQPKIDQQDQPAAFYKLSERRANPISYTLTALNQEYFDDGTITSKMHDGPNLLPYPTSDLQYERSLHGSPSSPPASMSFPASTECFSEYQYHDAESGCVEASTNIIDSINDVIQGFPQQMLSMDTPCVIDIRYQNHIANCKAQPQHFYNPSFSSSISSLALDPVRLPTSPRRRTATNLFAPFFRATNRKSSFLQRRVSSLSTRRPSSSMSTGCSSLVSQSKIPPAEISIFRHIFPDTEDWWRRVLYAHLVAFNYVRENNMPLQRSFQDFPSKACRTLGISHRRSRRGLSTADTHITPAELEGKLVECVTWIAGRMVGTRSNWRDARNAQDGYDRDQVLVRALAEIAKLCESGGAVAASMSKGH